MVWFLTKKKTDNGQKHNYKDELYAELRRDKERLLAENKQLHEFINEITLIMAKRSVNVSKLNGKNEKINEIVKENDNNDMQIMKKLTPKEKELFEYIQKHNPKNLPDLAKSLKYKESSLKTMVSRLKNKGCKNINL